MAKKRITKSDLLLSGWHSVFDIDGEKWAHPERCHHLVPFSIAKWAEKKFQSNDSKGGK